MIFIGIGSNLPGVHGGPLETCGAALESLARHGIAVVARSPWYESAPVPVSDQPWFINGVVQVDCALDPPSLLDRLHQVEASLGRVRGAPGAARILDLDLLSYHEIVRVEAPPLLPHPRLHERAFVLLPLRDVAPAWRHPTLGLSAADLAHRLPHGQAIRRVGGMP